MQHPDEGTIHAWLDGELPPDDATALEAHIAECAECARAVAEARGLVAGSSRIVSALDSVPGGVIPVTRPKRRAWYSTIQFRAAAALLLVAGTSLTVMRKNAQQGDKAMLVASPRAMATDAISTQPQTPALPREIAASKPPKSLPSPMTSSNTTVAAGAAPVEKRRADLPSPARAVTIGMVGAREMALKSAAPSLAIQDSAPVGAMADESVIGANTLRLVRTDSMRATTQRVFEMANGVQLIMTESVALGFSPGVAQSTSAKTLSVPPKEAVRASPTLSATRAIDQIKLSDYRTITWVDPTTARNYSLTGPLSPEQLEKLKALVMKLSQ